MRTVLKLIFIFFFGFIHLAHSQKTNDDFVNMVEGMNNYTEDDLIAFIIDQDYNDFEIARFFYFWIAVNIQYDDELASLRKWKTEDRDKVHPINVLKSRKAICEGYAQLYKYLLEQVDLEVEVISGHAKRGYTDKNDTSLLALHAWNAVMLNEKWKLVDVTWGNNLLSSRENFDYWFDVTPDVFIVDHFPLDRKWQLLDNPMLIDEFAKIPDLNAGYFLLGFDYIPKESFNSYGPDSIAIKIGLSHEWSPKIILVDEDDNRLKVLPFKKIIHDNYQVLIIQKMDANQLLRLDAYTVNNEEKYIEEKIGLAYFKTELEF